jgi:hypothetical protein
MLNLAATTDSLQVQTDSTTATAVHASYADFNTSTQAVGAGRQNTSFASATTSDVVSAPAANVVRNIKGVTIRNTSASSVVVATVLFNQNGTTFELIKATLQAGEQLQYTETTGWFVTRNSYGVPLPTFTTADQAIGASVTVYLTGSAITLPSTRPAKVGTIFKWRIVVAKSAAATATMTADVRFGTNGTTGDTSRCSFVGPTQTAAADEAQIDITATVRGPIGASCVVQGTFNLNHNLAATGFSNVGSGSVISATSAAFDITTANIIAGVSITTGASHSLTVRQVIAELINT